MRAALTALAVFFAFPALSQEMTPREVTGAAIGSILVTNHLTHSVEDVQTFDINGVEVIIHYQSTPNYVTGVDPRDIVTVTVPDGYVAVPFEVLLPEGETVEILIYEALIG